MYKLDNFLEIFLYLDVPPEVDFDQTFHDYSITFHDTYCQVSFI